MLFRREVFILRFHGFHDVLVFTGYNSLHVTTLPDYLPPHLLQSRIVERPKHFPSSY
jgi:hypothetical protein